MSAHASQRRTHVNGGALPAPQPLLRAFISPSTHLGQFARWQAYKRQASTLPTMSTESVSSAAPTAKVEDKPIFVKKATDKKPKEPKKGAADVKKPKKVRTSVKTVVKEGAPKEKKAKAPAKKGAGPLNQTQKAFATFVAARVVSEMTKVVGTSLEKLEALLGPAPAAAQEGAAKAL